MPYRRRHVRWEGRQDHFLAGRTALARCLMLDHDHSLRGQFYHLPTFYLQGRDITQVVLTCWTGLDPKTDHLIGCLDHAQQLSRMTWLTSCLLAALFPQAPGLALEAIRRGRQMALVLSQSVFFFRCHSFTVAAFPSSGKSSRTRHVLLTGF